MTSSRIGIAMVTGLGIGRLRPAPGSLGSIPPVALAIGIALLPATDVGQASKALVINLMLLMVGFVFAWSCVRFGADAERRFGRKDAPDVVADEIAGQSLALLGLPWRPEISASATTWNVAVAITAYAAFRIMDIAKPPPANALQRLEGGWGILIDDLIAGAYALIVAQVMARWVLPHWIG